MVLSRLRTILWNKKTELVYAHRAQQNNKILIIFEGFDCAGKTSISRTIAEHLPSKSTNLLALGTPTRDEESQLFGSQRFISCLPAKGEMNIFDRSYYSRANVENVMKFVPKMEVNDFLQNASNLEDIISNSGVKIIKYWIDVSPEIQKKRLDDRISNPLKQWKLSPIDMASMEKKQEYIEARDETFLHTHKPYAPWYVVNGDNKLKAKINCINHLIGVLNNGHGLFKEYENIDSLRITERYN